MTDAHSLAVTMAAIATEAGVSLPTVYRMLFQRLDDAGGMVRVATTVGNPVLAAALGGQVYTGPATVAGKPYFTAYAGVHSPAGALIGMLYVGLPIDARPAGGG